MRRLRSLSDGFGADADRIGPDFREVWDAFFAAQVLVFRSQRFSPGEFLAFARQFGKPEPHVIDQFHHPEHPDILILSNVKKNGEPIGLADAGTYFHTDYSYLELPARATIWTRLPEPWLPCSPRSRRRRSPGCVTRSCGAIR